jgi:CheY-like chemotaxis protein
MLRISKGEASSGNDSGDTNSRAWNASPQQSQIVQIYVSNTGPGIHRDQIDKIFDRFYQADNNYKKDVEGSGIGLALTKELVEICYGKITVSSTPNKKTTFVVTLPIAIGNFNEDEIVDNMQAGDSKPETGKNLLYDSISGDDTGYQTPDVNKQSRVLDRSADSGLPSPLLLIVEDNTDVANYIYSFMENDYRIMTAENGKIGLEKILDKYPDLVISDIMMPEMDGFELCQKVKSDERISHIPIILLTAKADLDSKLEGLVFGADDYVTKPFEAKELQIRSKNLIEQRRKLREKFSVFFDLKPEDIAASSMDEQLLHRLLTVFEDHMEEQGFGVENLAREIGLSRVHLNRKIQALTNQSARDFIRTLRLQKAARMLRSASGTVSEIAYKVGFNNLSHFSKVFHRHFGKLPSEFSPTEK